MDDARRRRLQEVLEVRLDPGSGPLPTLVVKRPEYTATLLSSDGKTVLAFWSAGLLASSASETYKAIESGQGTESDARRWLMLRAALTDEEIGDVIMVLELTKEEDE